MSVGDVKATLRDGTLSLDQAKATIERVGDRLAEVRRIASATLHDSQHPEAQKARKALADAAREVELALRTIGVARGHAIAFTNKLG